MTACKHLTASGYGSVAMGLDTAASQTGSVAMGSYTTASGYASMAMGCGTTALGYCSVAFGTAQAIGNNSVAMGSATQAIGNSSTAMGSGTSASGYYSTSSGFATQATSYASFAIGAFNVGLPEPGSASTSANPNSWVPTDPLFEVGNGGNGNSGPWWGGDPNAPGPSDALVVYKNGDTAIQGNLSTGGVITAAAGGDIPMCGG